MSLLRSWSQIVSLYLPPQLACVGSNGLALDRQGRLLIATWSGRSIDRIEKDGKRTILADRFEGKRFGGTNDLVVKKDGAIYFTDGFGGLRGRDKDPGKELDSAGIYMWKDGKVTLAIKDIATPNGLAFSPDEKILYANGRQARYVRRYDVQPDDTLTNSQLLIDMNSDPAPGISDGMKVDQKEIFMNPARAASGFCRRKERIWARSGLPSL